MADKVSGVLTSATSVLTRAVDLDSKGRYGEALICYQEGLHLLMEVLKSQYNYSNLLELASYCLTIFKKRYTHIKLLS